MELAGLVDSLRGMHGFLHKSFALLLALLLVVVPVGNTFGAMTAPSGGQVGEMHAMHHQAEGMLQQQASSSMACDHCVDECCTQGSCASASCGVCATPVAVFYTPVDLERGAVHARTDAPGEMSPLTDTFFRPPRA